MKHAGRLLLGCTLTGLWACQLPLPTDSSPWIQVLHPAATPKAEPTLLALNAGRRQPLSIYKAEPLVHVEMEQKAGGRADLRFRLQAPIQQRVAGFGLKALDTNLLNRVKIEVTGIGITDPLWAQGADSQGMLNYSNAPLELMVPDVPVGTARVARVQFYTDDSAVPGAVIAAAFDVTPASSNLELSFRSNPAAAVIDSLLAGGSNGQHLASRLSLPQLQGFIDAITGISGSAPDYSYTTHPSLVKATAIAADLQAQQGALASLEPANPVYRESPANVRFNLSGLSGGRLGRLQISDPASAVLTQLDNGSDYQLNGITPGNWQVQLSAPEHLPLSLNLNAVAGQTHDLGTLSLVSTLPQLDSLSSPHGSIGSSLTLQGHNFGSSPADNTVRFGSAPASVISASSTSLTVSVPAGIAGNQSLSVSVNGQNSNSLPFAVTPTLSQWLPAADVPGAEVVLQGSGFSSVTAENTVSLCGQNASVSQSSAGALTLSIPTGCYGIVPATVTVGSQSSTALHFSVRPLITELSASAGRIGESLSISGLGFDPAAANNQVSFNGTLASVSTVTPGQLSVSVPQAASGPLQVSVGSQTSNGLTFNVLPTLSLNSPAEGAQVSGLQSISTSHTAGNPVQQVAFFLDGSTLLHTATAPPYAFEWDSSSVNLGPHTLHASLTDSAGNTVNTPVRNIEVVGTDLTLPGSQISFGPAINPELIHHFEITGPGGQSGPLVINPYAGGNSELNIQAYDYRNQLINLSSADFIWSFGSNTPYPGNVRYPYQNLHRGLYNNGIRKGSATLSVNSRSTGLSRTLQVQALDVPPRITSFSITPAPISSCSPTLPSETDIVCAITIADRVSYSFSVTFEDGNEDLIVTENSSLASRGVAYENQYYTGGNPPYQSVPQPGNAYNVYFTGFPDYNINPLNTAYGYSASSPNGGVHTKTYSTSLKTRNADSGGGLRIKASSATGQVRQIFWEIAVQ